MDQPIIEEEDQNQRANRELHIAEEVKVKVEETVKVEASS